MKISAYALIPALALAASQGFAQQQPQADPASPPAAGQTQPGAAGTTGEQQSAVEEKIIVSQADDQIRADRIIGAPVRTGAGDDAEEIGQISDLVFDADSNLVAAVIGVGGFLGIGQKSVALSWDALEKVEQDGDLAFTSTVSRQQLEDAAPFETREDQEARLAEEKRKQDAMSSGQGASPGMGSGGGMTGGAN